MITILSLLFISTCTINSYRLHLDFIFLCFGHGLDTNHYTLLWSILVKGFKYCYFVYDLSAATFPLYLSEAYKGE